MKQNYFVVDNKRYDTGTVFIVYHNGNEVEASFLYYDTEYKKYAYKIKDCVWYVDEKTFNLRFVSVTDKFNHSVSIPQTKTMKDIEVDGLFIGWVWYIFLMIISTIFNDAIGLWILISIVFFSWRSDKIKKEGTYVEW